MLIMTSKLLTLNQLSFFTKSRPASMLSQDSFAHFAWESRERSWRANRRPRALMQHANFGFGKGCMATLPGLQSMQATLTLPGPACDKPPNRRAAGLA